MEGPVYPHKLEAAGIEYRTPTPPQRQKINRIIFEELVNARFLPESLAYFTDVIGGLKNDGCDAAVLGCTEIPLIVNDQNSPLPTLDSTRLLARAALHKAING
jgi:aspartate racemase